MALPLPSVVADVGPGGPLVTSMGGMNALTQSNAQAKYAPYTTYADAASKLAYANMLPYQIQAQVLSNPMMWMALKDNPEAANAMLSNFAKSFPQGNNMFGGVKMPMPNQMGGGNVSGLFGALLNKLGIGSGDQDNSAASPQNAMTQMPQPSSDSTGGGNALSGGRPPQPQTLPGSGVPTNPFTQLKQTEASAAAQGTANVGLWKDLNESSGNASVQAQDALNDIDRFREAYGNLGSMEKGVVLGHGPAVTSEAQIADQAANSMRASLLRQLQQGHITNKDFDIGMNLKPSRALNPDAEKAISSFMQGSAQRAQERVDFNNQAQNMGLTVPQANLIWTKYIHDRPFYDAKSKSLIEGNLGSWTDYLQPDRSNAILSGNFQRKTSNPPAANKSNQGGFDPTKMLDYKFNNAEEFKNAFDSLGPEARAQVVAEMHRRGWK